MHTSLSPSPSMTMQFTSDERHRETLNMLSEVRQYMARWPAHPVHREMLAKVDAHLADPDQRLVQHAFQEREGAAFTAGGLCLVRAVQTGSKLRLSVPSRLRAAEDSTIAKALRTGVVVHLQPIAWRASSQAAWAGSSTTRSTTD
jgi:hypothetical protein